MKLVRVKIAHRIPFKKLHPLDRQGVVGERVYCVESVDEALDTFHDETPIKVLDDFEISAEVMAEFSND